jgi:diguanylate cyclase (GGDEF)-like protein
MKLNLDLRPEELRRNIASLDWREYLLLISSVLFVLLLGVGLLAVVLSGAWTADPRLYFIYASSIGLGLIVARFVRRGRMALHNAREKLVRTALGVEGVENLRLLDPLTGLLNRLYLEKFAAKETGIAKRVGLSLTLVMIGVGEVRSPNDHFADAPSDRVLAQVGEFLRTHFRSTDTLIRYSDNSFLLLLLGCKEPEAQEAAERLLAQTDRWNREKADGKSKISLKYSTAAYADDLSVPALLETLDQKMHAQKPGQPPRQSLESCNHRTVCNHRDNQQELGTRPPVPACSSGKPTG